MAHSCLLTALGAPRVVSVQLPLFLVPSLAGNQGLGPHSCNRPRSYASHAKMPKTLPKNKRDPIADPNASRKHLKADFPLTTRKNTRDMNRRRGVSAMRSTGPRQPLSVSKWPLPVPESNAGKLRRKRSNPIFDPRAVTGSHGLWGFFYDKKAMAPPEIMGAHGRDWTYAELSAKSFEDLHALYWIAHKEGNRITTNATERQRVRAGYGESEDETRLNTIKATSGTILKVLRDRYESAEEAGRIADSNFLADLQLGDNFDDYANDGDQLVAELTETPPDPESSSSDAPPTKLKF